MERGVGKPSLVKMEVLDVAIEQILDRFGVVKNTVIGRLRDRHDPRLNGVGIDTGKQGVGANLVLDRFNIELAARNRADDAEMVARRTQKNGDSTRHHDAVQNRLVAVAIYHDHVTGRDGMMPDHLVRGRGAVGHEKAVIGVEDPRGVALGRADGAVVVQQLAQLFDRVAYIGA